VYLRSGNDAHLSAVETQALELLRPHPSVSFVLTGKAASIQPIRQFLRRHGSKGSPFRNKVYWAPSKKGMD
jgi:hypothetical protein